MKIATPNSVQSLYPADQDTKQDESHVSSTSKARGKFSTEEEYRAHCSCCGSYQWFALDHYSFREGYNCPKCKASMRYRAQAEAIIRCFRSDPSTNSLMQLSKEPEFASRSVFEPGIAGPFRKYFRSMKNYQQSFYWEDVELGGSRGGVRCESLEQLSYKNETFDLVISSDILEHVRKPMLAFAEIYRVLRPGGVHIFSIPVEYPMPAQTIARVDVTGEVDVHLLPEHYHGDGAGGKSLVYNDFGADVIRQLNHMGYMCETERPRPGCPEAGKMLTFLSWKM